MGNEIANVDKNSKLANSNIRELAKLCSKDVDITPALSENTVDNMKAFLVAYSRSQLVRVIKLTDALGKLEDSLIEESMRPENLNPDTLMAVIRTIQNSLNAALSMIKQVTSDESYINVIVNQTNTINNTLNQYNINHATPVLENQDSRDKVRNIANQILSSLNQFDRQDNANNQVVNESEEDVIDVEDMEETEEDTED